MWLEPNSCWITLNPFTLVNSSPRFVRGNFKNQIHLSWILFPSALADGFDKLLYGMALATYSNLFIEYRNKNYKQKVR